MDSLAIFKFIYAMIWFVAIVFVLREFFPDRRKKDKLSILIHGITWVLIFVSFFIPSEFLIVKLIIILAYLLIPAMYYSNMDTVRAVLTAFGMFIMMNIGEFLMASIMTLMLDKPIVELLESNTYMILGTLVSSFFFVVMAKIINIRKYFKAFKADFNRNQRVSIVGFIVLTIMVVFVNAILLVAFMDMQSSSSIMFLTLIFVMYVAFILGFVRVNRNLSVKTEEYEQLKFYTSIIENLVDASNKFRHDYRNIMLTFDGYLRNNEYDKLRGFYDTIVKSTAESLDNSFYQLKHVKDAGIKGLLTMKMNNAVSAGVNVEFEAKKDVDIAMDTLDLSRILGIFIDNAQEAATDSEQKRLRMGFMVDEDSITFLIANTFSEKPDVNDIYKQGVSSKGKGRGTGLATVREIIDTNYQNVILNTTVEDGYFIQEMIFEK